MKKVRPTEPEPATSSRRQQLLALLGQGSHSFEGLRRELRSSAKALEDDLRHLALSLKHKGQRIEVEPASCLECDFVFRDRERYATPSRCPKCRSERIDEPRFSLKAD